MAPKITHIACPRVRIPALANPMEATVTAPDDCTTPVISAPDNNARSLVRVHRVKTSRSIDPAASFRPSVISRIPNRNRPIPPIAPPI